MAVARREPEWGRETGKREFDGLRGFERPWDMIRKLKMSEVKKKKRFEVQHLYHMVMWLVENPNVVDLLLRQIDTHASQQLQEKTAASLTSLSTVMSTSAHL